METAPNEAEGDSESDGDDGVASERRREAPRARGGDGARVVDGEVAPVALELGRMHGKMRAITLEFLVAVGELGVVGGK